MRTVAPTSMHSGAPLAAGAAGAAAEDRAGGGEVREGAEKLERGLLGELPPLVLVLPTWYGSPLPAQGPRSAGLGWEAQLCRPAPSAYETESSLPCRE
mmetsp:Transcript_125970/g.368044  ORF Transcript_125970/g.368044 Transcript_125970/m.368044 type:complete len:98 (-) Transcript_125970:106-399(-)